jgi:hypothetical protein
MWGKCTFYHSCVIAGTGLALPLYPWPKAETLKCGPVVIYAFAPDSLAFHKS